MPKLASTKIAIVAGPKPINEIAAKATAEPATTPIT